MILMYHKIYPESPTIWWVSVDDFYRHMVEIKHKKVVYLDDYDPNNPDHVVITFDGVYENVYKFALPILKKFGYPFELFISGDHIGKDNDFDKIDKRTGLKTNEPQALFANITQLKEMVSAGGRIQWHTRSHENLAKIEDESIITKELKVPSNIKKIDPKSFNWFAYPHGEFNERVIGIVQKFFDGALSVCQGDEVNKYKLNRITVTNQSSFKKASIGVVIASYNYGKFLVEAIESVLKQTRPVDKILIADDASTDNTKEISEIYSKKYPHLISYIRNEKNLGIIRNFNKAIAKINTDYVCILGADNRFVSNYIELTSQILDSNNHVAIAYTDFALFGPKASSMFARMPVDRRGEILEDTFFVVRFPEFNEKSVKNLNEINFMHGSSLFRKDVFDEVGGYNKSKKAEDHNLFQRMIESGHSAARVPFPILEYRQHSNDQANTKLISFAELKFYKEKYKEYEVELTKIKSSKFWKLLNLYKNPKQSLKYYILIVVKKIFNKIENKLDN